MLQSLQQLDLQSHMPLALANHVAKESSTCSGLETANMQVLFTFAELLKPCMIGCAQQPILLHHLQGAGCGRAAAAGTRTSLGPGCVSLWRGWGNAAEGQYTDQQVPWHIPELSVTCSHRHDCAHLLSVVLSQTDQQVPCMYCCDVTAVGRCVVAAKCS
jgi:hypothetical protein